MAQNAATARAAIHGILKSLLRVPSTDTTAGVSTARKEAFLRRHTDQKKIENINRLTL